MKTIYLILILFFLFSMVTLENYSQTYLISQGGTVTTCSGNFYDSGGASGNYSNNEDFTITFFPATSGSKLQFVFTSFNLESHPQCKKDYFRIYDGVNISSSQIGGNYCGNNSPGTVTATNADGALTFVFYSNGSGTYAGWIATISCTVPPNLGLWTGLTSTDWNTASNWYNNLIPIAGTNVTIPSTATNWPVYYGNLTLGSTCNDITMDGSSQLTITGNLTIPFGQSFISNGSSYIRIGGNISRTGIFTPGNGTVEFYGTSMGYMSGPPVSNFLIDENFGTFPGNWSGDVSSSPAGDNFYQVSTANAGGTSPEIRYEKRNGNNNVTKRMYHSPVNTTGASSLILEFKHSVSYGSGNYALKVEYSTDGTTWQDAGWTIYPNGNIPSTNVTIPLTSAQGVGSSTYYISFTLDGVLKNVDYWYIDDVRLSYTSSGNPVNFHNLLISKSAAEVIAETDLEVDNQFTIMPGAYFTNSSGQEINVNGNLLLEANLSGMASFIDNGSINVTGSTSVQQYLTSERWHLVSSPISDAAINTYYDIYLKQYNEPTDTWTYLVLPVTIPMNVAAGYSAWASDGYTGTTTVTFETVTGQLNNSDYYIDTLEYTPGAPSEGFNLLGNPYPSALEWNSNWSLTNLNGWMQIYDNGVYRGYNIDGTSYNDGTPIIPSTQGFWIRATGSNASLTIPKSQRVHDSQAFYKQINMVELPTLSLISEINGMKDEAKVVFSPNATKGFDITLELEKFDNVDEAPTLYTLSDGKLCGVNYLPPEFNDLIIPLGFKTGEAGIYQIGSPSISNFPGNIRIYLEDVKNGNTVELNENSVYEFNYSPLDESHRFNLKFKDTFFATEDAGLSEVYIYSFQNKVYIKTPGMQHTSIAIYDLMGREIAKAKGSGEDMHAIEVNKGSGYYLVKVQTDEHITTQKVFIR